MRLVKALCEGNPDSSSAINSSGRRPIRVLNSVGEPGLTAYEVDNNIANVDGSASRRLCSIAGADALERFLDQQGYNLNPEEWYPS
ncbi:MAG: hypothetical protein ACLQUY_23690 [Ktedonobacterales bacterium]